jgi:hypothetical protein
MAERQRVASGHGEGDPEAGSSNGAAGTNPRGTQSSHFQATDMPMIDRGQLWTSFRDSQQHGGQQGGRPPAVSSFPTFSLANYQSLGTQRQPTSNPADGGAGRPSMAPIRLLNPDSRFPGGLSANNPATIRPMPNPPDGFTPYPTFHLYTFPPGPSDYPRPPLSLPVVRSPSSLTSVDVHPSNLRVEGPQLFPWPPTTSFETGLGPNRDLPGVEQL